MKRRGTFLDTGILLAAVIERDPGHADAIEILANAGRRGTCHTSDYVLAEGLNYVRQKVRRKDVAERIVRLAFGDEVEPPVVDSVLRVHGGRFAAAWERYRKDFDRGLSLTDWTSVVLVEEERLAAIATFDGGFRGLLDIVDGRG